MIAVRKAVGILMIAIGHDASRASLEKRANDCGAKRAGATGHNDIAIGKIAHPRPRFTRIGNTWNSIQLAISPVRSFGSSTFLLMPCRHASRLSAGFL